MPKKQGNKDDLSTNQEHLIAFLVIALFGLMYWFFMHEKKVAIDTPAVISKPLLSASTNNSNDDLVPVNNAKQQEVEARRKAQIALEKNKVEKAQRLSEIERIKAELTSLHLAEIGALESKYSEKITQLEASLQKQEKLNTEKTARVVTLAEINQKEAKEVALELEETKKLAETERQKVLETSQKLSQVESQKESLAAFEAYNSADLNASIEVERKKAEAAAKKLAEAKQLAEAERIKAEQLIEAEKLKLKEAKELAELEKLKAEETAKKLAETERLAEAERIKAEETAMKLADLKALKEKQAILDAENAARLAANIEAKRLEAEAQVKAERLKLKALKQQKDLQDELNATKAAELAASIEAERAKAEKIEKKLAESKKQIEEERLKAKQAAQQITDLEKLKAEAEAQQLSEKQESEFAESKQKKVENELAKTKRIKEEEQAAELAKEKSKLDGLIEVARETLALQELDRSITDIAYVDSSENSSSSFENMLKLSLERNITDTAIIFDKVLFAPGSAQLNDQSISQIESAANILKSFTFEKILLRGHTDNTGDESQNLTLSLSRSLNIKNTLISLGINPEKISTEGLGSQEPVADNATISGRKANRRIDLLLIDKEQ